LTSKAASFAVSRSGWRTTMIDVCRPKYCSTGRPLTRIWPVPFLRKTRAIDDLRRPVP
jgi:hypothetical protein